jgi:hypothetical protein
MRKVIDIPAAKITPDRDAVLAGQGIPIGDKVPESSRGLSEDALRIFAETATPRGLFAAITKEEFAEV